MYPAHYGGGLWICGTGYEFHALSRAYDPQRGWLTNIHATNQSNQTVTDLNYRYRADGRVSAVKDNVNPAVSAVYDYDRLNRLSAATAGVMDANWQISSQTYAMQWSYDDFGNRLTQSGAGIPAGLQKTLSYDPSTNRITTGGYTYDLNGNITGMPGVSNVEWDVFDRMSQATANGTTVQYKYDAFGRRVAEISGGTTNYYFYDMNGQLLWSSAGGSVLYFAGQRLGEYGDRLGSTRYTRTGSVFNHYYPFGEDFASASTGTKYAETYRDSATGLDYALNRYYASSIGRQP